MAACEYLIETTDDPVLDLILVETGQFDDWLEKQKSGVQNWIAAQNFKASGGAVIEIPNSKGQVDFALALYSVQETLWDLAALPSKLTPASYQVKGSLKKTIADDLCLGWSLGSYSFDWYKESTKNFASLVWPKAADQKTVTALASGIELTRDLVNLPAADLGPAELAQAVQDLGAEFKAKVKVISDQELLDQNFPAIYAVGKGAEETRRPCLIDLQWGKKKDPKMTLVGKGVCFDSGGLDIKPAQFMKLMKKDMGGAAHVLGIARAVMGAGLPVNLRVLVPAVENAVDAKAMRPMDVVESRKGTSIEIGHTDAEGRVILADALTLACEDKPEFIVDFATLTGAARVALGTELPALFVNDEAFADQILKACEQTGDPFWRLPLWKPYRKLIDGKCADISNEASAPYGGAITAGLFLQEFIEPDLAWAHVDVMAWNTGSRPGRPEGGEAMGVRAVFQMIKNRTNAN